MVEIGIILVVIIILAIIYILPHFKSQKTDEEKKSTGGTKDIKEDIIKSVIHFLITTPLTIIYFLYFPKFLSNFIEPMSLQWAYAISALLFVPIIGIAHYLWGEHWKVGKKQQGFVLVAIVALTISLLYIYYPEGEKNSNKISNKPVSISNIITISESGIFNFELDSLQSVDKWLYVKKGLYYRLSASAETPYAFFIKYKRGGILKINKNKTKIPHKAGPFKIMAGEKSVKITLLVTRRS